MDCSEWVLGSLPDWIGAAAIIYAYKTLRHQRQDRESSRREKHLAVYEQILPLLRESGALWAVENRDFKQCSELLATYEFIDLKLFLLDDVDDTLRQNWVSFKALLLSMLPGAAGGCRT